MRVEDYSDTYILWPVSNLPGLIIHCTSYKLSQHKDKSVLCSQEWLVLTLSCTRQLSCVVRSALLPPVGLPTASSSPLFHCFLHDTFSSPFSRHLTRNFTLWRHTAPNHYVNKMNSGYVHMHMSTGKIIGRIIRYVDI